MQAEGPVETLRISGSRKFGSVADRRRDTRRFDLPTAQRLFDMEGKLDEIPSREDGRHDAAARLGDQEDPAAGHRGALRRRAGAGGRRGHREFISFLQYFLLAFGGVALFVGAFVIANSLSITIAQRTREFATLRTLGASRGQVLARSSSRHWHGRGRLRDRPLPRARARERLFALFDAVGFTLPNSGLLLETRTIVVSLLLGILVTLSRASSRRFAPPACRRSPRCARVRRCPPGGSPASGRRAAAPHGGGFAALLWGLFHRSRTCQCF